MEFLNVLAIKKIVVRKGCMVFRTATIKYRHYVQLHDAKGQVIDGATRGVGFSLLQAKRTLEALPDLKPSKPRVVDRKRSEADMAAAPTRVYQRGAAAAAARAPGRSAKPVTRSIRSE